jgi:hypothetical protein
MPTVRSTNMEIDTGANRKDNLSGKKPHEVVFEDEQANRQAQRKKTKCSRWHVTALRLHWQWAGHAARRPGTTNYEAVTAYRTQTRRGRPQAQWSSLLRSFSIKELNGTAESWITLAQNKADWIEFSKYFTQYVETTVLRQDTRATLARDARAVTQDQTQEV